MGWGGVNEKPCGKTISLRTDVNMITIDSAILFGGAGVRARVTLGVHK